MIWLVLLLLGTAWALTDLRAPTLLPSAAFDQAAVTPPRQEVVTVTVPIYIYIERPYTVYIERPVLQYVTLRETTTTTTGLPELRAMVDKLSDGLREKTEENKMIINWIWWWWSIGWWWGWIWWIPWIIVVFQYWRILPSLKGFWPAQAQWWWKPWWWWFVPFGWFVPWAGWGWVNWFGWWHWWAWIWWAAPWIWWIPWWIVMFKEKNYHESIWLARRRP